MSGLVRHRAQADWLCHGASDGCAAMLSTLAPLLPGWQQGPAWLAPCMLLQLDMHATAFHATLLETVHASHKSWRRVLVTLIRCKRPAVLPDPALQGAAQLTWTG